MRDGLRDFQQRAKLTLFQKEALFEASYDGCGRNEGRVDEAERLRSGGKLRRRPQILYNITPNCAQPPYAPRGPS